MLIRLSDGKDHDIFLVDDGTLDTVIEFDLRDYRFSSEFASAYKDKYGRVTDEGLEELANHIVETEE